MLSIAFPDCSYKGDVNNLTIQGEVSADNETSRVPFIRLTSSCNLVAPKQLRRPASVTMARLVQKNCRDVAELGLSTAYEQLSSPVREVIDQRELPTGVRCRPVYLPLIARSGLLVN